MLSAQTPAEAPEKDRRMFLGDWLKKHSRTARWLAAKVDVSESQVSRWIHGQSTPSVIQIVRVQRLTGGDVGVHDWFLKECERKQLDPAVVLGE